MDWSKAERLGFREGASLNEFRAGRPRHYPAVPEPVADLDQLVEVCKLLKESVEILVRDRGDVLDSSVNVRDLPVVERLIFRGLLPFFEKLENSLTTNFSALYRDIVEAGLEYAITNVPTKLPGLFDVVFNENTARMEAELPDQWVVVRRAARVVATTLHVVFTANSNETLRCTVFRNGVATAYETLVSGSGTTHKIAVDMTTYHAFWSGDTDETIDVYFSSEDPSINVKIYSAVFVTTFYPRLLVL